MKLLRSILDKQAKLFTKGGKLAPLYPLYEAGDTFLYTPGEKTKSGPHVRDALDLKRMMITVVIALIPCTVMAIYNTGLQAQHAFASNPTTTLPWQASMVLGWFGLAERSATLEGISFLAVILHGLALFLPLYLVTMAVGGGIEALFCMVRKHEINEGFLVTGLLYPLVMPPTVPLWQAAVGIAFGVIIGKEVFGGTGMNILNPALTARAFVFFAYPAQMSGDGVWVGLDGYSAATPLAVGAVGGLAAIESGPWSWWECFLGGMPGSCGETSTLACLIGAAILIFSRVGSWRIMAACALGLVAMATLLNVLGKNVAGLTNPFLDVPFWWHFVMGGFAFGAVFMATDPVSASITNTGKWIYGFLIGALCVMVRVLNPAYPEGMMLAILFMNVFAPLIDYYVVKSNISRRELRVGLQQ
ncbi:MAG: NADH:ubiquinone reductase (Na(+)-transporting) subunit B [Planctomycetota bacterium]